MQNSNKLIFYKSKILPVILQSEAAECGLACLAMIASYHGHRIDLTTMRSRFSISLKGATLAQLIKIAEQLRLFSRPVRAEMDELAQLLFPVILHWDFNHFVVLEKIHNDTAVIIDPAHGRRTVNLSVVSKRFTGIALELRPNQDFEQKTEHRKIKLFQLIGKLPGITGILTQIFLLAGALEVFTLISPFFMQLVIDSAIVSGDRDLLTVLGIGFLILALIQVGITAGRSWIVMVLGTTVNLQLVANLFRHLLRLPMDFFEKRHLGDIVSRFESLNEIQRTLTTSFIEAIVDGVMVVSILVMMLIYSPQLTAIVCAAAVLYGLLRWLLYRPLWQAQEEQILRSAKQQSNFLETVRGIQSVKLFNGQLRRQSEYQNLMVDQFNAGIRVQKLSILYKALNGGLFGIENVGVICLGATLILNDVFSVGMLFAFVSYKQQFTSRIISFIEKTIEFKMLALHTERVSDVALTAPESSETGQPLDSTPITADIELKNVSFRYSSNEPLVLRNASFKINEGESVALIGPSGCGKTTLIKILLGLMKPTKGEIIVGGHPLNRLGNSYYRELVGAVMQEDQLFAGSISDNICFFHENPDQKWIESCANLAAIDDDIQCMPMGYNTLIGDMGTVLSGGQKQRILLARALYKKPRFLLLDEATSHLDIDREALVNVAVKQLKLTRIIIAHRPETIASADRILVLQDGNVNPLSEHEDVARVA